MLTDPTFRPRNATMLAKTYAPKQKFRFAVPQHEFLDFSGPGGEPVRKGKIRLCFISLFCSTFSPLVLKKLFSSKESMQIHRSYIAKLYTA